MIFLEGYTPIVNLGEYCGKLQGLFKSSIYPSFKLPRNDTDFKACAISSRKDMLWLYSMTGYVIFICGIEDNTEITFNRFNRHENLETLKHWIVAHES